MLKWSPDLNPPKKGFSHGNKTFAGQKFGNTKFVLVFERHMHILIVYM